MVGVGEGVTVHIHILHIYSQSKKIEVVQVYTYLSFMNSMFKVTNNVLVFLSNCTALKLAWMERDETENNCFCFKIINQNFHKLIMVCSPR